MYFRNKIDAIHLKEIHKPKGLFYCFDVILFAIQQNFQETEKLFQGRKTTIHLKSTMQIQV